MSRAEKMIRLQISELTHERIAPRKAEIEQSIKIFYWWGKFNKKKQDKLLEVLHNKYTQIMNEYNERVSREYDRYLLSIINGKEIDYMS